LTPICNFCKSRYFGGHCPSDVEWRAQMTPAFFLQTKKGHGFSRFQRQAECRLRCLPSQKGRLFVTAATFSLPIVFVLYPHTRSTLRDNRIQRERWDNYTIFTLRTAKKGAPFAYFAGTVSEPFAVPLGNAAFPVRQAVLSGGLSAPVSAANTLS